MKLEGWLFQRQPTMAGSIETRKGKIQEFHPFNSSQVYTRTCNWDTEVWNPWLRIDNFGCNTASELANLLGALLFDNNTGIKFRYCYGVDLNNIYPESDRFQICKVVSNCTNRPQGTVDGYMFVFRWSTEYYVTQFFIDPNSDSLYIRSNVNSSYIDYRPWAKIFSST